MAEDFKAEQRNAVAGPDEHKTAVGGALQKLRNQFGKKHRPAAASGQRKRCRRTHQLAAGIDSKYFRVGGNRRGVQQSDAGVPGPETRNMAEKEAIRTQGLRRHGGQ